MTGEEFVNSILSIPKYQKAFHENLHFNEQMQYIKRKEKVTQYTLLNSIEFLSNKLLNADLEIIRIGDDEHGG